MTLAWDFAANKEAKLDKDTKWADELSDLIFVQPYDPPFDIRSWQSGAVVQGVLTKNELSTGIGTGTGTLGARFTLTRNGAAVYDKDLVAQQLWDGNFIGAIAIPDAINHYQSLYKDLVEKLLADEEFRKAATR